MARVGRRVVIGVLVFAVAGCSEVLTVYGANSCDEPLVVETFDEEMLGADPPASVPEIDGLAAAFFEGRDVDPDDFHATTELDVGESTEIGDFCCVIRDDDRMVFVVRDADFLAVRTAAELRENHDTFVFPVAACPAPGDG